MEARMGTPMRPRGREAGGGLRLRGLLVHAGLGGETACSWRLLNPLPPYLLTSSSSLPRRHVRRIMELLESD